MAEGSRHWGHRPLGRDHGAALAQTNPTVALIGLQPLAHEALQILRADLLEAGGQVAGARATSRPPRRRRADGSALPARRGRGPSRAAPGGWPHASRIRSTPPRGGGRARRRTRFSAAGGLQPRGATPRRYRRTDTSDACQAVFPSVTSPFRAFVQRRPRRRRVLFEQSKSLAAGDERVEQHQSGEIRIEEGRRPEGDDQPGVRPRLAHGHAPRARLRRLDRAHFGRLSRRRQRPEPLPDPGPHVAACSRPPATTSTALFGW